MFSRLDNIYFGLLGKTILVAKNVDPFAIESGGKGNLKGIDDAVTTFSQDLYTTMILIGGFGAVLCLMAAFLKYMASGKPQSRDEAKTRMVTILLAVAGVFAAVAIVGIVKNISIGLSNELK